MCSCIRPALFPIQYLPIGCAPSTRSFVLPRQHSILLLQVPRAGIVSCMLSMEPHAVGLSASRRSGRLRRVRHDRAKQRRAEQRAERPGARLVCIYLCISVHMHQGSLCRRTSYQQPETDVGNFSICKGKAPAPLACSITQRNATDLQLRKLIPQPDGTRTNLGIASDPSSSCPSF